MYKKILNMIYYCYISILLAMCWYLFGDATNTYASESWVKTNIASMYIETLETTPWGILAGEKDPRLNYSPFNGIYKSSDFGDSWEQFALENKGVNSIAYNNGYLYAATYYSNSGENGLFISEDGGYTWNQKGPKVSTSKIVAKESNVLLGTYSHGLWISQDKGNTWQQKIGDGYTGPQTYALLIDDANAIVSLNTTSFISTDNLQTWREITALRNQRVRSLAKHGKYLFAGTDNSSGILVSKDAGATWYQNIGWGINSVDTIYSYRDVLYAGTKGNIFKSYDNGATWISTNLNRPNNKITSVTGIYKEVPSVIGSIYYDGVYSSEFVPSEPPSKFLEIPWQTSDSSELIKKVYSFFDHAFPLLGYANYSEDSEHKNTTVNFLGIENKQPEMFYSSHDGIDFALPFGTPIIAAYDGTASYNFDKFGLGHYITITHPNGYKTIYAHLQSTGLITNEQSISKEVAQGDLIGKVGMSGNTTGPHLHFALQKTTGSIPENRIDPFGWVAHSSSDPWSLFEWQDILGLHMGPKSYDLWLSSDKLDSNKSIANIEIYDEVTDNSVSIFIRPYAIPNIKTYSKNLSYINGSSTTIELVNLLGETIKSLSSKIKVTFDLSQLDLSKVDEATLKIYYFDESKDEWIGMHSIFDPTTKIIETEMDHLTWFAVFGSLKDSWKKTVVIEDASFNITK